MIATLETLTELFLLAIGLGLMAIEAIDRFIRGGTWKALDQIVREAREG